MLFTNFQVHGHDGARLLAQRLRELGVTELEFISDEGLPLSDGIVAGITGPVARYEVLYTLPRICHSISLGYAY